MVKLQTPPARVEKASGGLAFFGAIDSRSVPALLEAMPELSALEAEIDLSEASHIDSAGLAFLIHWGNQSLASDQKIRLRGVSTQARQLIDIMSLNSFFEIST